MIRFVSRLGLGLLGSVAVPTAAFAFAKPSAIGVPEFDAAGVVPVVALVACLVSIVYYRARASRSR